MNATVTFKRWSLAAAGLMVVLPTMALAQDKGDDPCRRHHSDRPSHCEVRDTTVPNPGTDLSVDATPNGGITVRGWNRQDMQVRAIVVTQADSEGDAVALGRQVQVFTDGGRVRTDGPSHERGRSWSVSFEVMVPSHSNLDLRSTNGGLSLSDVAGNLELRTTNGGIRLARVGGRVRGNTTNGGIKAELDGTTWNGEGMDIETHNGGVDLRLPDNYSAHLEADTSNGGVSIDFPITMQGELTRKISTDIGSGGPTIRVRTTNGGVRIGRR